MADPFDIPSLSDEPEHEGAAGHEADLLDVPELDAAPKDAAAPAEASWLDILLAGADGASLGHGKMGQAIGDYLADKVGVDIGYGKPVERPEGTQKVGGGVMEQVPDTGSTRTARVAGTLATAIPATIAGGGSVAGQAAAGAALGAGQAHGTSGGDWLETLQGGLTGGALGALGGAAGKAVKPLAGPGMIGGVPSTGTRAGQVAEKLGEWAAPSGLKGLLIPEGARNAGMALTEGALAGLGKAAPGVARAGTAAAPFAAQLGTSKAKAQDNNGPRMSWAIESVLSSGASQLPQEDEHRLTEAVLSGDSARVNATNFQLQQRYPAYAKRMREQLESLSQQEE
jgi:hypothetical protein